MPVELLWVAAVLIAAGATLVFALITGEDPGAKRKSL